ncbi:hypothetical protein KKI95_16900 [Xenorhabdus bovienii]|uniref:hypothetical protein n=1 Tax=Xenorhabdus bovienii TaxID=40576 RepID=UPI0023B2A7F0|nr:hypothetical protein [Xenorhabdus bovienii]MDE9437565.1 hypothetical protein [Xenorhabdus bovienii]
MKLGSLYAVLSELQKSADLDEYQQALDSVLLQIPLNDEKIKNEKTYTQEKINFPLSTLLLPSAMNHYCPEFIPIERNIGIDIEKKLIQDIPLALSRTYITSFVNGKNLKYTCTMLSGMLGVFAGPIIGIILDLIFPPKSLDMEQIMKEVRKQIGGEIGNYDKEKLLNKFDNTSRKANLLAELIKQLEEAENKNDKETANKLRQQVSTRRSTHYDDCLDLANEVLVPPSNLEEYYIHYKLAPLYPLVMNAAISSISSYLIEFRVNKAIIDDYTSLLNKSYGFLQKLEEQALSLNNGAIRRDEYVNWVTWRKRYYVKDFINGNSKVEAKTILRGQTSHINLMYWNAWHIYIDTTNFHPDIKILGYFDMDKGKENESVI